MKMRLFLVALFTLMGSIAMADDATIQRLENAKRAYVEKSKAEAVATAPDGDVETINVRIDMKAPEGQGGFNRGRQGTSSDVVFKPGDPGFAEVLAAAKAAMAAKASKATQDLESSGVTIEIAPPIEEVVPAPVER